MLDFFIASSLDQIEKEKLPVRLSLDGANYWLLHRYFVHADLNPGSFSFLNQYEDTELAGYQLYRFETELKLALQDLQSKPSEFRVLKGWDGTEKKIESEDWGMIKTAELKKIVDSFLILIGEAKQRSQSIWAIGD